MSLRKWVSPLVVAGAAGMVTGAEAPKPTYEQLEARVQQLESAVQDLHANQAAGPNTQDVQNVVEQVIRDADQRSQLLQANGGLQAGYDKGFFIRSDDGAYVLKPGVQFQFRGIYNFNDADSDESESGFEVRRVRFRFDGNFISPDLTYSFVWDTNRNGGAVTLLDAWAQYKFADEWAVKLGQFKESFSHEKDISGFSQLAVDRSLVDTVLGGNLTDRVQGMALVYGSKENPFRAEATFSDGDNSKNTDFRDNIAGTFDANWGAAGRVEYKVFGDWANYRDFTAKNNKVDLLVAGAGTSYTERDSNNTLLNTLDLQYENTSGLGLYGAVHGNFTDLKDAADDDSRFDWGALAQVGYLLNKQWEVFGRYDVILLDEDFVTSEDTFNEFTAGVNYYLGQDGSALHRAKITVDVVYLPDGSPSAQTGSGITAGEEDQIVLRGQFQLVL